MAKPKALKVFRTVAGFHDAYVATPTKKAALEAWGSTRNLFAMGQAEQVTDPALSEAPLVQPGKVIRVSRGTMAQQLAALPADKPKAVAKAPVEKPVSTKRSKREAAPPPPPKREPVPRPKRAALDAAEERLSKAERKVEAARAKARAEIDAIKAQLAELDERWERDNAKLTVEVHKQREAYDEALARWQADES